MKTLVLAILSLASISTCGFSPTESDINIPRIDYMVDGNDYELKLDYNLNDHVANVNILSNAFACQKYLTNQLDIENGKFDRLIAKKRRYSDSTSLKTKQLDKEIVKQLQITSEILSRTEAVEQYIDWLENPTDTWK